MYRRWIKLKLMHIVFHSPVNHSINPPPQGDSGSNSFLIDFTQFFHKYLSQSSTLNDFHHKSTYIYVLAIQMVKESFVIYIYKTQWYKYSVRVQTRIRFKKKKKTQTQNKWTLKSCELIEKVRMLWVGWPN